VITDEGVLVWKLQLSIGSLYRRVAASVAGIFDIVIDERIFGGPMVFWLPASSRAVVQKQQKFREQKNFTSAFCNAYYFLLLNLELKP
jgi:hypothetical protein